MVCSLAPVWCATSAQGVLISESSMANVLDAHSRVIAECCLLITTLQVAHQIQHTAWCVEYNDVMCYMLQAKHLLC